MRQAFDGGPAGQFGVQVAAEGVEVHPPIPFQTGQQVFQQGLGIPVDQEIRQAAHYQGIAAEGFSLHPSGGQLREERCEAGQRLGTHLNQLRRQQGLDVTLKIFRARSKTSPCNMRTTSMIDIQCLKRAAQAPRKERSTFKGQRKGQQVTPARRSADEA